MSSLRFRRAVAGCVVTVLHALVGTNPAYAATISCAERGASFRHVAAADGTLEIRIEANDAVTWQSMTGSGKVVIDIGAGWRDAPAPGGFQAPAGLAAFKIRIDDGTGSTSVSCFPAATTPTDDILADIGATGQVFATNTGVAANTRSRFGIGGNIVSRNQIYVSTSNMRSARFLPPAWNAWASLEGRSYSGGIEGATFDLVAGVDYLVSPDLLVGMLGGMGRTLLTVSGTPESSYSPMLGAYFGRNFNDQVIVDGFIYYARPVYAKSGASFTSARVSAALNVTGYIEGNQIDIEPFLFARGYQENQPSYIASGPVVVAANEVVTFAASLGVRVRLRNDADPDGLAPYFSAASDMKRTNSTLAGADIFTAPRLSMGLAGRVGAGQLSINVDFGKSRSDTYDRGLKIGYDLKF